MKNLTLFVIIIFVWVGCRTSKSPAVDKPKNRSHYYLRKFPRSTSADSAIVVGHAENIDGRPLTYFLVKINKQAIHQVMEDSVLTFKLAPGKYRFTGASMGYYPVNTEQYEVNAGDSVNIHFYLQSEPIE